MEPIAAAAIILLVLSFMLNPDKPEREYDKQDD
jgi:hypothetical protein